MKLRHIIIIAIFILVNIAVLATLNFVKGDEEKEEDKQDAFISTLKASVVHNTEETLKVVGYGTVSSFNSVDISSEMQGKLNRGKHYLKPGVKFRKGDLLFKINDTDARYTLRARKSAFINIIANLLPDLQIDFSSEYSKWSDYINSIKLNQRLPQLPAWKTDKEKIFLSTRNVLTEYFTIKSMEEKLNKYAAYAPFSGVITDVYSTDQSVVNPGARIMRIVETDNFEIPASIPKSQLGGISIGTEVTIYTTTGELKGIGNVVRISEVLNKTTQSIDVFIRPKSIEGQEFTEGEYVRVEIDKEEVHTGFEIPNGAIIGDQVFTYSKKDSLITPHTILIVGENENGSFVTGLKDKAIVITQEVLNYTDSTKYDVLIK